MENKIVVKPIGPEPIPVPVRQKPGLQTHAPAPRGHKPHAAPAKTETTPKKEVKP